VHCANSQFTTGVVHRDIATRNVLLGANGQVYLCDCGLALQLPPDKDIGTAPAGPVPVKWMAPEAIRLRHYSRMTDVWMFGVFLWELLAEQEPFLGLDAKEAGHLICDGKLLPDSLPGLPDSLDKLLKDCWQLDEKKRLTMKEVHDFIGYFIHQTLPMLPSPVPSRFVAGVGPAPSKSPYVGGPAAAAASVGDKKHYYIVYSEPSDDSV